MDNPFDFSGPEFLVFYLVFALVVLAIVAVVRRIVESDLVLPSVYAALTDDFYGIAYLVGGAIHVVQVAALKLLEEKRLTLSGNGLVATDGADSVNDVREPIERAVLKLCESPCGVQRMLRNGNVVLCGEKIAERLTKQDLLPSDTTSAKRSTIAGIAIVVLIGVAMTKIVLALSRGHTNIAFLIILAIVFCALVPPILFKKTTRAGQAALERLRTESRRPARLRLRGSTPGLSTDDAALACLFGFAALPTGKKAELAAMGIGNSPSGSDGSSGGDGGGGGSSCGGGGGGGGGGGCGGCGGGS